jgi:hypothetical protein
MPPDRPSRAGRARSRSESRADPANVAQNSSSDGPGRGGSGSDSESGADRSGRMQLICPGCNKGFDHISSLRRHRNAWSMAAPRCRAAASQLKRPRRVRVDTRSAQDATDGINEMMGDGANSGAPHGAALYPSSGLQPRDEVGEIYSSH